MNTFYVAFQYLFNYVILLFKRAHYLKVVQTKKKIDLLKHVRTSENIEKIYQKPLAALDLAHVVLLFQS